MIRRGYLADEFSAFIFIGVMAGVLLGAVWGYFLNIVAIVQVGDMLAARILGILLPPLGAVLGWIK